MTKAELKRVAKQLDLPEDWEVTDVMVKDNDQISTDYIFVKVHIGKASTEELIKSYKENGNRIVKKLNKLTAKTADGTWKYVISKWTKTYITINFLVDFTFIRAVNGNNVRWKALPLGKKYRKDKYISRAVVKRAMNKYFNEGKYNAASACACLACSKKINQIDFEEIRFKYE